MGKDPPKRRETQIWTPGGEFGVSMLPRDAATRSCLCAPGANPALF